MLLLLLLIAASSVQSQTAEILAQDPAQGRFLGDVVRKVTEGFSEGDNIATVLAADALDALKSMVNYRINGFERDFRAHSGSHEREIPGQGPPESPSSALVSNLMRMMGYQEDHMGPMLLKLFFYVGELALKSYMGAPKTTEEDIPTYRTIIQQDGIFKGLNMMITKSHERAEKVQKVALDPTLPQDIIDGLQNRTGAATSCVQLFICKMSPVIWKVQEKIKGLDLVYTRSLEYNVDVWSNEIYETLPEQGAVTDFGKNCDERFPTCPLIDFTQLLSERFSK
eukprot:maker-scaffold176_size284796-snap-gene-0.16 protein:Tk06846 transcript:maker-scaffold176_size284796-snap-gene-0.16-mRNA-1 annotation:"hypothetical protein KGM_06516"